MPSLPLREWRVLTFDLWVRSTPTGDGFRAAADAAQTSENRHRRCRWQPTGEYRSGATQTATWRYLSNISNTSVISY